MVQVLKAKAIFDCNGDEESELTFLEGDILTDGKGAKVALVSLQCITWVETSFAFFYALSTSEQLAPDSSLPFQLITVIVRETSEDGWLHGRLERTGEEGLFPDNYVELIRVEVIALPYLDL